MSLVAPGIYFLSNFTLLMFHIPQPVSHLRHLFSPTILLIETSGPCGFSLLLLQLRQFLRFNPLMHQD